MIDDSTAEAFKESVLTTIQWTEDMLVQEFRRVLNETQVTEDAGVIVPQFIHHYRLEDQVVAWTELPVTSLAEEVYKARLDAAAAILRTKFHVEQSSQPSNRQDEITFHRLCIRYVYDRPV